LGSVMSPIGNPQNLLIANHGFANPFPIFLARLSIPTFINLILLYAMVLLCYRNDLNKKIQHTKPLKVLDKPLALLCKIALLIMLLLIAARITLSIFHINYRINFSAIALISAAPILLFSKKRFGILRKLDWHTLVFFIALFVFIEAVWLTEFFQHFIKSLHLTLSAKPTIISISVLLSQLISNVPLVALYLPLLAHATHAQLLALAVGSTVAGNLLILGAASNVIVIQNAEKRGVQAFSFWEFFKLGLPLTLINILVYYWFI